MSEDCNTLKSKDEALVWLYGFRDEFVKAAEVILSKTSIPASMAEDMVQDTFIKISKYDDLHEKNSDGKLKGYFFISLRSVIGNYARDKKRFRLEVDYDDAIGNDLPDEVYNDVDNEYSEFKQSMLDYLSDQELDWFDVMLFKKYIDSGLTYDEIANVTTLGVQTIHQSMKRCKNALRNGFKDEYKLFLNNINGEKDT